MQMRSEENFGSVCQSLAPAGSNGPQEIPVCGRCGEPVTMRSLVIPAQPLCDEYKAICATVVQPIEWLVPRK
jgi:hypothetical protein